MKFFRDSNYPKYLKVYTNQVGYQIKYLVT